MTQKTNRQALFLRGPVLFRAAKPGTFSRPFFFSLDDCLDVRQGKRLRITPLPQRRVSKRASAESDASWSVDRPTQHKTMGCPKKCALNLCGRGYRPFGRIMAH